MSNQVTNKAVIELLCKYLKLLLDVNVDADHFRCAKFSNAEDSCVTTVFWDILYKICKEVENSVICYEDDVVTMVKLHFCFLKYESLEFYCLPVDMSNGSRELLLALGWLMATQDVLHKLTQKRTIESPLSMEFGSGMSDQVQSTSSHSNSKQKDLNYILWLAGKLKLNMREIAEADQERIRLTAQVHKDSLNSCGLPHLSVADTRLVHDTQLLSSSLDRLKKDAELFHTHKYWRKKNHVFWKWMETVLVKKEESKKSIKIDGEQKQELIRFLNVLCRKLNLFLHSANTKTEDTNAASSEESTIQPVLEFQNKSSASYPGVPRFLRVQKKGKETTEVERWLQSSELLLQNLEKECRGRESEINCELDKIAEKMKHIIVLPKSRRSKSPRHPHVF